MRYLHWTNFTNFENIAKIKNKYFISIVSADIFCFYNFCCNMETVDFFTERSAKYAKMSLKLKYVNYHFPLRHPVTLIQGDQLYIAVGFWYLVKSDLSSVYVYRSVHQTSHFLQDTKNTRSCLSNKDVQQPVPNFSKIYSL